MFHVVNVTTEHGGCLFIVKFVSLKRNKSEREILMSKFFTVKKKISQNSKINCPQNLDQALKNEILNREFVTF